jgi:nucleotidyltransferase substrate binding protein (TIGR01987 family)
MLKAGPMAEVDLRWRQRFDNFQRALQVLGRGVQLAQQRPLSELEQQGLIKSFEFTHELAWNLLKDYLQYQGIEGIIGSRDATRLAFQNGLISDGEGWMAMIKARNQSSHTYNLEQAQAIAHDVIDRFASLFGALRERFAALSNDSQ